MSEAKEHKLYTVTANWNKLRSHLYIMTKEEENADLLYIADVIWEDRYLSQIKELHVMTALLLSQNHAIKMIEISTKQAFSPIMHKFFDQYVKKNEYARLVMKEWLSFRDQKIEFHQDAECWSYQTNSKSFWNFCRSFAPTLSCLARRVMMLPANSVLTERNWSIMNLIMNETRNSLNSVNVNKLMFIYMNERTLNRLKNTNSKLKFDDMNIDEAKLCEIKNRLLQKKISLVDNMTTTSTKRPTSQTIVDDASRPWIDT